MPPFISPAVLCLFYRTFHHLGSISSPDMGYSSALPLLVSGIGGTYNVEVALPSLAAFSPHNLSIDIDQPLDFKMDELIQGLQLFPASVSGVNSGF